MSYRSCYPIAKKAGETLCSCYHKQYGVKAVVARQCHVFGPGFSDRDSRVTAELLTKAACGEDLVLRSDGSQVRSYLFEIDACCAYLTLLLRGEAGGVYNVSPAYTVSIKELAEEIGISVEKVKSICDSLEEFNPMLGHRGCRLGNTYPEITEMQARAIIEAAIDCKEKGIDVHPEIMVPLVGVVKELEMQSEVIRKTAEKVFEERGTTVSYKIGTMIEVPRAALVADKIAQFADFFSFGTNDLTQMTFGYSRDDAPKFLKYYKEMGIIKTDPFEVLDQEGVGQLVEMGTKKGRSTKQDLKVGICGEHGGEPSSVKFCAKLGMNYVSCSPFRVPIARVAAAQAAIE